MQVFSKLLVIDVASLDSVGFPMAIQIASLARKRYRDARGITYNYLDSYPRGSPLIDTSALVGFVSESDFR